jgi:hypothetical protein
MALISLRNAKLVRFDKSRPHWLVDGIDIDGEWDLDRNSHLFSSAYTIGKTPKQRFQWVAGLALV